MLNNVEMCIFYFNVYLIVSWNMSDVNISNDNKNDDNESDSDDNNTDSNDNANKTIMIIITMMTIMMMMTMIILDCELLFVHIHTTLGRFCMLNIFSNDGLDPFISE